MIRWPLVVLTCVVVASVLRAQEEKAPDAGKILARIDAALFFPDAQPDLTGYTCKVSVTTAETSGPDGKLGPDRSKAKPLASVAVDATRGTRSWKDGGGKTVPVGAWTPSCGPWTLTNVTQIETELFLSPLAPRFAEDAWKREVAKTDEGWRLVLTPKSSSVNPAKSDFLTPATTRLELRVDSKGVPVRGTLGLQLGPMSDDAALAFEFADFEKKKRIASIRSTISSANLTIHPVLSFEYQKQGDFFLPETVLFEVPARDLSPSLGRMMPGMRMKSALLFSGFDVKGKKAKR